MKLFVYESKKVYDLERGINLSKDPVIGYIVHGEFGAIPLQIFYPRGTWGNISEDKIKEFAEKSFEILRALRIKHERGIDFEMDRIDIRNVYSGIGALSFTLSNILSFLHKIASMRNYGENLGIFIPGKKEDFTKIYNKNLIWSIYELSGLIDNDLRHIYEIYNYLYDLDFPDKTGIKMLFNPSAPSFVTIYIYFPTPWRIFLKRRYASGVGVLISTNVYWNEIVKFVESNYPRSTLLDTKRDPLYYLALYLNPYFPNTLGGIITEYFRKYYNKLDTTRKELLEELNKLREKYSVIYISNPAFEYERILQDIVKELKERLLEFFSGKAKIRIIRNTEF